MASVMVWFLSYAKSLKDKLAGRPLPSTNQLEAKDTHELYPYRESVESITDRTTELLTRSNVETERGDR
jgi:hypothetical protein